MSDIYFEDSDDESGTIFVKKNDGELIEGDEHDYGLLVCQNSDSYCRFEPLGNFRTLTLRDLTVITEKLFKLNCGVDCEISFNVKASDLEVTISGKDIDGKTIVSKCKGYVVDEADRGGAEYAHLFMPLSLRVEDENIRRKDFTVAAQTSSSDWGGSGGGGEASGSGASGSWSSSTSSDSSSSCSSSYDSSSSDSGSCGSD